MTYEDIINDNNISFVVLRPSISESNPAGITILRKSAFSDIYSEAYTFERVGGENNDIAYLVRRNS